jgi:hypothetical protein
VSHDYNIDASDAVIKIEASGGPGETGRHGLSWTTVVKAVSILAAWKSFFSYLYVS